MKKVLLWMCLIGLAALEVSVWLALKPVDQSDSPNGEPAVVTSAPPAPIEISGSSHYDLTGLSKTQAAAVVNAMTIVFKYFSFGTIGQRYPGKAPPEVAELAGGECDSAVEAVRRLLKDVVKVSNLDLVVPKGDALAGHTIGYIETPVGHILLGTTFGLIFVHVGNMDVKTAFRNHAYRVYSIGVTPENYAKAIGATANDYYDLAADPRTSFALPNEDITAETGLLDIRHGLAIGKINNDQKDITSVLGSYHEALGNRLRPSLEIFHFKGKTGQRYVAAFVFKNQPEKSLGLRLRNMVALAVGGTLEKLVNLSIDVVDDAGNVSAHNTATLDDEHHIFRVNFKAPSNIFELRFSSNSAGAKVLDMIAVTPTSKGDVFTKLIR